MHLTISANCAILWASGPRQAICPPTKCTVLRILPAILGHEIRSCLILVVADVVVSLGPGVVRTRATGGHHADAEWSQRRRL
jgi:hypothetical protein